MPSALVTINAKRVFWWQGLGKKKNCIYIYTAYTVKNLRVWTGLWVRMKKSLHCQNSKQSLWKEPSFWWSICTTIKFSDAYGITWVYTELSSGYTLFAYICIVSRRWEGGDLPSIRLWANAMTADNSGRPCVQRCTSNSQDPRSSKF